MALASPHKSSKRRPDNIIVGFLSQPKNHCLAFFPSMELNDELLARLLEAHGFNTDTPRRILQRIKAPGVSHHTDKAVLEVGEEGSAWLLFVNNAGRVWPSTERLEARLSAIIRACSIFPQGVHHTAIVAPLRTMSGSVTLTDTPHRWYLTPIAPGRDLDVLVKAGQITRNEALHVLSMALGSYHRMMAAAGPPASSGVGDVVRSAASEYGTRMAATYRAWAAGDYSSITWASHITTLDRRLMEGAWEVINFLITQNRLEEIDALPRTWVHDDFQFKNILLSSGHPRRVTGHPRRVTGQGNVGPATHSPETETDSAGTTPEVALLPGDKLSIIDLNDGTYASRLFDFFFPFTQGVDAGPLPQTATITLDTITALFQAYIRGGGAPLTPAEIHLLPNILQLKALATAEYFACLSPEPGAHEKCTRLLAWVGVLAESRSTLRAAAPRAP
jgi:hypothetical protein